MSPLGHCHQIAPCPPLQAGSLRPASSRDSAPSGFPSPHISLICPFQRRTAFSFNQFIGEYFTCIIPGEKKKKKKEVARGQLIWDNSLKNWVNFATSQWMSNRFSWKFGDIQWKDISVRNEKIPNSPKEGFMFISALTITWKGEIIASNATQTSKGD